jgi:serine/threonine-protein kinase
VDIYALGVVAYECLAGRPPFDGESPVAIALKHIREQPPPLPPDVPPAVRAIVDRAMSKDPSRRWPSAAAMSQAARQSVLSSGEVPDPGGAAGHRTGMVTGLGLDSPASRGEPSATETGAETGFPGTGFLDGGRTYRVTRETWQDGTEAVPATTEGSRMSRRASQAGRGAQQRSRRRRTGPIVAGVAGCVVVVGLVAAAVNTLASTNTGAPATFSGAPPTMTSSEPSPSPSRTRSSRPVTHSPRPSVTHNQPPPVQRPLTPSPSHSPTPSPSPSPSKTVALVKVPALKGLTESAAKAALAKVGLKVGGISYAGSGDCEGMVTQQSPAAGTAKAKGSLVAIIVSKESCPSPSPSASPSPSPSRSPRQSGSPTPPAA